MFFKKKKPNRLYIPTKTKWYQKPKREPSVGTTRKVLSIGLKTRFSRIFKDFFLYLMALLVLGGMISFLLFSSKFSINKIEVARNDLYVNSAGISKILSEYKGKSIFTFSKTKAEQLIREAYPEFSKVEILKLLPDRIKVELQTHDVIANVKAYYILPEVNSFDEGDSFDDDFGTSTSSRRELTPIEQTALLNSIGQALFDREENPELRTILIEGLTQPIKDREFIIPKNDLQYMNDTIKYLTNILQMEVKQVRYLPIANEIHLTTTNDMVLWLMTKKPYKEQLDRFNTVYKTVPLDEKNVVYADLRVNQKVIYCLRGAACDK